MFKIGDRVICTNSYQASKLTINQKYIVKDIILFPIENKYYYELSGNIHLSYLGIII